MELEPALVSQGGAVAHTESTYFNRSLKNLSQVITATTSIAVQNFVEIRPWGASNR